MREKEWVEVCAHRENHQAKRHPRKPPLAQRRKKGRQCEIQRSKKEEAVKAYTVLEPLKKTWNVLCCRAVKRSLHFVFELLLGREFAMRHGIRLHDERGRHAILVTAEHVRERGPRAGGLLVLNQRDRGRRQRHQGNDHHNACQLPRFLRLP